MGGDLKWNPICLSENWKSQIKTVSEAINGTSESG